MFTKGAADNKNKQWSEAEVEQLKNLISLAPALNDPNASYKSKQEALEGVAKIMQSRTVEQCKAKLYNINKRESSCQQGGSSSATNLPSSTVGLASSSTNDDNMNMRRPQNEKDTLKTLISLPPVVKDSEASQTSTQEAQEGIPNMMQSKRGQQCKSKNGSQQGGTSSETNLPSSTVGLTSPSTSKSVNTLQISSTSETASRTVSAKQPSTDTVFEHNIMGNKIRRSDESEDSMHYFFRSISSDIQKLSQDKQMTFKQKVIEVIVELRKDDD